LRIPVSKRKRAEGGGGVTVICASNTMKKKSLKANDFAGRKLHVGSPGRKVFQKSCPGRSEETCTWDIGPGNSFPWADV